MGFKFIFGTEDKKEGVAAYPGRGVLGKQRRKLMEMWSKGDPVDKVECERAKKIEEVQGNRNSFVMDHCD
jgi:deoxyribonuclease I